MSLPQNFKNAEEYFEECLKFFQEYQYLFNYPNTDILIHNILDKITINDEEIEIFDKYLDLSTIADDFLSTFFMELKKLQVFYQDIQEDALECSMNVPVSPKKKHEIIYLAKEIKGVCENVGCDVVVDFGSGLVRIFLKSYLNTQLYTHTNV